jgi:hypothetical protein
MLKIFLFMVRRIVFLEILWSAKIFFYDSWSASLKSLGITALDHGYWPITFIQLDLNLGAQRYVKKGHRLGRVETSLGNLFVFFYKDSKSA